MKLFWYDNSRLGACIGGQAKDVTDALSVLPAPTYPFSEPGDSLVANLSVVSERVRQIFDASADINLADIKLRSPVANPTKIIGVPVNYLKHVEEAEADLGTFTARYQGPLRDQGLFLKANSSLVGCGEGVKIRMPGRRTDHEVELAVIIGKKASFVSKEDAYDYIAGYCIALDMVVRGPEDRSFRKSIDTYSVLGPWLVTADEIKDPQALDFRLSVNGEVRQASNTLYMIMNIAEQIEWASRFYTLYPGDVIMSGTCEGVGQVVSGDLIECEMQGVGSMSVRVS